MSWYREHNRRPRRAELLIMPKGRVITSTSGIEYLQYKEVTVGAWTSAGGGKYYYDLQHNKGREIVFVQLYDRLNNAYSGTAASMKPKTGYETSTLRITLNFDPGADRITIGYA